MAVFLNAKGTTENQFSLGKKGPILKNSSSVVEFRNAADSAYIEIKAASPTTDSSVATKQYADSIATGLDFKDSVHVATTTALDATYDNGTSGFGATLTANTAGVIPIIDTHYIPTIGTRILVKNQTDETENGIYTITDSGSGQEVTEITVVADVSGSLGGTYFTFNDGTTDFYVWFNNGSDPTPGGTGIAATISNNATATEVRDAIITAINASAANTTAAEDEIDILWLINDSTGTATDSGAGTSGFTVSTVIQGTASPTDWVLTRAIDADNSPGNEVSGGMFVFIEDGVSQAGTSWVLSYPVGNATLGTDNLTFSQFSGNADIIAGTNLNKVGNTINLDTTLTNFASTGIDDNASSTVITIDSSGNTTFTGPILASNGTAAAPSFSFSSNTNTGMFRQGSNSISFATGGTTQLSINSSGDLQVGNSGTSGISATFLKNSSNVNYLKFSGGIASSPVKIEADGTDTNISIAFNIKGTGTLNVSNVTNYENNVSADDDIPNKKFIDDNYLGTDQDINTQTGTTYTAALSDKNGTIEMNNASANTFTIPANSSVAFSVKSRFDVVQYGAGTTTIQADTGVTLNGVSGGSATIQAQYSGVTIYKRATDEWIMIGNHSGVA